MKIVFGGSFNPPTKGHFNMVKKINDLYEPEEIILIPVGDDYKKPDLVSFHHRFEMVKILFSNIFNVSVSNIENENEFEGTIETLNKLENDDLYLLIGADQLLDIKSWIRYEELLKIYPLIVVNRDGLLNDEKLSKLLKGLKYQIDLVELDDESSSSLYRKNKDKYSFIIDDKVLKYIKENNLYWGETYV